MYEMLRAGTLVVTDACPILTTAIEAAEHDKQQPEAYVNVVNDPKSDARDGCRYGLYSYHQAALKPLDVRVEERIARELKNSDLTSAMHAAQNILQEERQRGMPQPYAKTGSAVRRQIADWQRTRGR